ncbi:hypothetical protein N9J84_01540 [Porticoccaceae bacterium]|nr:hypothetical protein [Porticoccaceae bacterium]
MDISSHCVQAYRKTRHLKLAAEQVGIPWQTLYVHLKRVGEPVMGDKSRYGSDSDKLAVFAESQFERLVPVAENQNAGQFQAKVDFIIHGHAVDVKVSSLKKYLKRSAAKRWSFCLRKQEAYADFFVCFCMKEGEISKTCLLIPCDVCRHYSTLSLPEHGGKWSDYLIDCNDLANFFEDLPHKLPLHTESE